MTVEAEAITVVRVADWDEDLPESVGGAGGWFDGGRHTWEDYLDQWVLSAQIYIDALRRWIVSNEIRHGGDWHQDEGMPVFSDGTCAKFSMRAWGDLLAAAWTGPDRCPWEYIDFYCAGYAGCDHETPLSERIDFVTRRRGWVRPSRLRALAAKLAGRD